MAAVIGGETRSVPGRVMEVAGWFPALLLLLAAGAASFLQANHVMAMPAWMNMPLDLYHAFRDRAIQASLGKTVPETYADLAVGGVSLFTMASRKVLGFSFSIGGFIVFAIIAWFALSKLI